MCKVLTVQIEGGHFFTPAVRRVRSVSLCCLKAGAAGEMGQWVHGYSVCEGHRLLSSDMIRTGLCRNAGQHTYD